MLSSTKEGDATLLGDFCGALLRGLGAMIGAGLCVGIAPAAAVSGNWLPLGIVAAAVLAGCATAVWQPAATGGAEWPPSVRPAGVFGVFGDAAALMARVVAVAALAGTCGVYLTPGRPALGAVGLLALVVAFDAVAPRLPKMLEPVVVCVVLAVLAAFVAACFALTSPGNALVPAGLPGADDPAGLPSAAAVMVFAFGGVPQVPARTGGRLAVVAVLLAATATYLAVSSAALRQLGAGRLALSPVPLRDALAAAEGSEVEGLLTVGVVLATAVAARALLCGFLADVRRLGGAGTAWRRTGTALLLAAVLAVLFPPVEAIRLAAAALLMCWVCRHVVVLTGWRAVRPWRSVVAVVGAAGSLTALCGTPLEVVVIAFTVTVLLGLVGLLATVGARR
ncbi:MAG: hypothetical protein ACRDQ5_19080 [Sciscionella sp.]